MPADSLRLDPKIRREQLLAFGRQHFSENSVDSCSMDELAKQAGVSKALLYHYFGGRRGFFLASARSVLDGLEGAMAELDEVRDVGALMGALVFYCQMNPSIYEVTGGRLGPTPELATQVKDLQRAILDRCLSCVGMGSFEDLDSVAQVMFTGWVSFVESSIAASLHTEDIELTEFTVILERSFHDLAAQLRERLVN